MARPRKRVKGDSDSSDGLDRTAAVGHVWLGELLALRLAGQHLAGGIDPDDHVRELREGWDQIQVCDYRDAEA